MGLECITSIVGVDCASLSTDDYESPRGVTGAEKVILYSTVLSDEMLSRKLYALAFSSTSYETNRTSENQLLGEFPPLTNTSPSDMYHTCVPILYSLIPTSSLSENSASIINL